MNIMRNIKIEKVTLNIGTGKDQTKLEKSMVLLKNITGVTPVKTFTSKRIPEWGLRPGLSVGCKSTLRKSKAEGVLKRLLDAKDFKFKDSQFDSNGNFSFGIHEYIDIPGVKYDPKIGIIGLEVCVTLERPGFRVKRKKKGKKKISKKHKITKKEATGFMKNKFNLKLGDE